MAGLGRTSTETRPGAPAEPGAASKTEVRPLSAFVRPEYIDRLETLKSLQIPSATRVLAGVVVLSLLVLGALLAFTPWVQTAIGTGRVTTLDPGERTQEIAVLVGGRIQQWHVHDGMRVKAGDPIVEIADIDPQLVARLEAERAAIASKYEAARVATETGKLDFDRQQRLVAQGLSSSRELEAATIKYKELKAKRGAALAALNKADINLSRQATRTVTAPRDGTIVRLLAGASATLVKPGETVATLTPSGVELAVEIFVSGLDAPLIEPGRRVRLEFEGWPAVQFSGWPAVAVGTFGGVVANVDPSVSPNGRFRILVVPDPADPWPDERYLRLGSQVKGWVLLNTVPLGYEVWRQLNRFPPLPDPPASEANGRP